jgi:regulatory protein
MISIDEPDFATIYNKSLDLLSRREHSVFELTQKLKKRYGLNKLINDVIIRLQESNLLDDQRFAEAYIKVRARKGFGPRRIDAELQQRKVSEAIINQELSMIENWNELALLAFKKKFGNFQKDTKEILKAKSFLQNRGFSFEQIEFCIQET